MINELTLLKGKPIEIKTTLKGKPIEINKPEMDSIIKINPLTLSKIEEIGEKKYNELLAGLNITKNLINYQDIPNEIKPMFNEMSEFEFLLHYISNNETGRTNFIESLSFFLDQEILFDEYRYGLYIKRFLDKKIIIDEVLFKTIKLIIYKQNYLSESITDTTYKPANEKAKQIADRLAKIKGELTKENNQNGLKLRDVISIVASYSTSINIINIWDLTVYQLYEEYIRLIAWDNYHTNYLLVPHVSDVNTLNLKHWANDINKLNK